jgi:hypothetical protein
MPPQLGEIQRAIGDDCRHAGGAFGAGHRDTVNRRLADLGTP